MSTAAYGQPPLTKPLAKPPAAPHGGTMSHNASPIIPAATLVIFRQSGANPPELLMIERASTMRFAGGAAVFPGGRVDAADVELARTTGAGSEEALTDTAARIAAIRETLEETGLLLGLDRPCSALEAAQARRTVQRTGKLADVLAELDAQLALDSLVPFARWVRSAHPDRPVGRFDTCFYLANLGTGAVEISEDTTESAALFWTSAEQALRHADEGAIKVIFPTRRNLERLAQFSSFTQACADAAAHPVTPIHSYREMRDGVEWLLIPEGLGYPVTGQKLSSAQRG